MGPLRVLCREMAGRAQFQAPSHPSCLPLPRPADSSLHHLVNATLGNATVVGKKQQQEGWYPFDTKQGKTLLGNLDLAFLGSYASELGGVLDGCWWQKL